MEYLLKPYTIYAIVFLAIVLPVLLWKREESISVSTFGPGGEHLPKLFLFFWPTLLLFEFSLGRPLARFMSVRAAKYERLIRASGLPLTPERIFTTQFFGMLGAAVLGAGISAVLLVLFPDMRLVWCLGVLLFFMFVGWVYPSIVIEKFVRWRQGELTRALPFAIDLIGSAMRSGLEFGAAMRYFTGVKMGDPLTDEFGIVLQQIELGKTRTEALADMAHRVQLDEFTSFVGVIAYGTEIGASIAETLRIHGEELRRARFHLAERKAARAPSLMIFPMALFIMPAVFIIIITPVIMQMRGTGMPH